MSIQNYNLGGLRLKVKQYLNEQLADGLWTSSELNNLINHGLMRVVMDTRILQRDINISVGANVSFYNLPSDTLTPLWIYGPAIWGTLRLFPSFLLSLDKQYGGMYQWEKDSANQSVGFVPFSYDKFIVWPAPSVNTTVTLHDVPFPAQLLNDTDNTALPLIAQYPAATFAAYLAQMKNDVQKAKRLLEEYKRRITAVLELTRHQDQTRPTVMVPAMSFDRSMANPSIRAYRNSRRYY
jgi:hypothetical protein